MAAEVGTPMNRRGVAGFVDPSSLQDGSKQNRCQKLTQIGNWQRALREFMQGDARLSDLVSLYGQKFVQLGENKNFTLSTLTDMVWTVLVLTWEAILDNKLPLVGEADAGYYKRYTDLKEQFNMCRTDWLREVSNLRDQRRMKQWSDGMQAAYDTSMEHDIFTFVPENALDDETREYFKLSMQENMKMALVKGAAAAGEQTQFLADKLSKVEEELTEAQRRVDQQEGDILKLQGELFEAMEECKAAGKTQKKEVVRVERVESKSTSEAPQEQKMTRKEKAQMDALEEKMAKLTEKLRALGFEGNLDDDIKDLDIEAIKKRWVESAPPSPASLAAARNTSSATAEAKEASAAAAAAEAETTKLRQALAQAEQKLNKVEQEREESKTQLVEMKKAQTQLAEEVRMEKKKAQEAEKVTKEAEKVSKKAQAQAEAMGKKKNATEGKAVVVEKEKPPVPTRSIGVGDHSTVEEPKTVEKEIVYVEKIIEKLVPTADPVATEAAMAAEVEKRLKTEVEKRIKMMEEEEKPPIQLAKKKKKKGGGGDDEDDEDGLEDEEEEEGEVSDERREERRKQAIEARKARERAMQEADGARADAEAYGKSLEKKNYKLETQLEQARETEEKLTRKVNKMTEEISEARDVRKKLEMSLAELNKKFQDLKYQLMDRGIDTAVIEEAMNDCGLEKIISGPVINVFDRLYHDAMKRTTRVSFVKDGPATPPQKVRGWGAVKKKFNRHGAKSLTGSFKGTESDDSESASADDSATDVDEASSSIFGNYDALRRRSRKSVLNVPPHLSGGKVTVRELGPAAGYTVKSDTAHLWARPDPSSGRMYSAPAGTEVIGVPCDVGGVRWLLVHSLRPKEWHPEAGVDDMPQGAFWALLDGGPLDIADDFLVPMRVLSAPRSEDVHRRSSLGHDGLLAPPIGRSSLVGDSEPTSPWSQIRTWPSANSTTQAPLTPAQARMAKLKSKTWAITHIIGAAKNRKPGIPEGMLGIEGAGVLTKVGPTTSGSTAGNPVVNPGVQGSGVGSMTKNLSYVSILDQCGVDEFGRIQARPQSGSVSRSTSKSGSMSGSSHSRAGSRPNSRDGYPGRSSSPIANRAAEATRMFMEGSAGRRGSSSRGRESVSVSPSPQRTLIGEAGFSHDVAGRGLLPGLQPVYTRGSHHSAAGPGVVADPSQMHHILGLSGHGVGDGSKPMLSPHADRRGNSEGLSPERGSIAGRPSISQAVANIAKGIPSPADKRGIEPITLSQEQRRLSKIDVSATEDMNAYARKKGWPYRSPRRSLVGGFYSNIDENDLLDLGVANPEHGHHGTQDDFNDCLTSMPKGELEAICERYALDSKGTKEELVHRLSKEAMHRLASKMSKDSSSHDSHQSAGLMTDNASMERAQRPLSPSHDTLTSQPLRTLSPNHGGLTGVPAAAKPLRSLSPSHDVLTGVSAAAKPLRSLSPSHDALTGVSAAAKPLRSLSPSHTGVSAVAKPQRSLSPNHDVLVASQASGAAMGSTGGQAVRELVDGAVTKIVTGATGDARHRTPSQSPARGTSRERPTLGVFNFTELNLDTTPRQSAAKPRRTNAGNENIVGPIRQSVTVQGSGQAQQGSKWRPLGRSPSQQVLLQHASAGLQLGQEDPSVKIHSRASELSTKARKTVNDLVAGADKQSLQGPGTGQASKMSSSAQQAAELQDGRALDNSGGLQGRDPNTSISNSQAAGNKKRGGTERAATSESLESASEETLRRTTSAGSRADGSSASAGSQAGSNKRRAGPTDSPTASAVASTLPSRASTSGDMADTESRPPTASAQGSMHKRRSGSERNEASTMQQVAGAAELPLQQRLSNGAVLPPGRWLGRSGSGSLVGSASAPALLANESQPGLGAGARPASGAAALRPSASAGALPSASRPVSGASNRPAGKPRPTSGAVAALLPGTSRPTSSTSAFLEGSQMSDCEGTTCGIHTASNGVPAAGSAAARISTTGDPLAMVELGQKGEPKFLPQLQSSPTAGARQIGGAKVAGKIFTGNQRLQQKRESSAPQVERRLVGAGQAPAVFSRGRDPSSRKLFLLKGQPAPEPCRTPHAAHSTADY